LVDEQKDIEALKNNDRCDQLLRTIDWKKTAEDFKASFPRNQLEAFNYELFKFEMLKSIRLFDDGKSCIKW